MTECKWGTAIDAEAEALLADLDSALESVRQPSTPSRVTPDFWPSMSGKRAERDLSERSWQHILPPLESEWRGERRDQRSFERRLPPRIGKLLRRVTNTHVKGQVLECVRLELLRRASSKGRIFETTAADEDYSILHSPRAYVPAVDAENLLREMAADGAFMLRLFKVVKALKKQARQMKTWLGGALPEAPPAVELPRSGTASFDEWVGISVAPLAHRPPEGVLVGLAQIFWRANPPRFSRPLRVLDWGAGNSPFARALVAVHPAILLCESDSQGADEARPAAGGYDERHLLLDEVDVLGDAPEFTFANRTCSVPKGTIYDLVLLQVPPPCATRGGHRDRHKDPPSGRPGQMGLRDLGRLGIRRWSCSAPRVIRGVLKVTSRSRQVALILPLFEVGAGSHDRVTASLSEIVRGVRKSLEEAGLRVSHDFRVTSTESTAQWQCLLATKGAFTCAPDLAEYDDLEAFLRDFES